MSISREMRNLYLYPHTCSLQLSKEGSVIKKTTKKGRVGKRKRGPDDEDWGDGEEEEEESLGEQKSSKMGDKLGTTVEVKKCSKFQVGVACR